MILTESLAVLLFHANYVFFLSWWLHPAVESLLSQQFLSSFEPQKIGSAKYQYPLSFFHLLLLRHGNSISVVEKNHNAMTKGFQFSGICKDHFFSYFSEGKILSANKVYARAKQQQQQPIYNQIIWPSSHFVGFEMTAKLFFSRM